MIYLLLFWEFCKVGAFCVGGGYASMPLIQASVVDTYHWLSMSEFVNIFTISQMTPGPIGINAATFVGTKIAGVGGAIAATVGFVTPSFFLGIILAYVFLKYGNIGPIRGALNGLRPAVVSLICAASLSFIWLAIWNPDGLEHVQPGSRLYPGRFCLLPAPQGRRHYGPRRFRCGRSGSGALRSPACIKRVKNSLSA